MSRRMLAYATPKVEERFLQCDKVRTELANALDRFRETHQRASAEVQIAEVVQTLDGFSKPWERARDDLRSQVHLELRSPNSDS